MIAAVGRRTRCRLCDDHRLTRVNGAAGDDATNALNITGAGNCADAVLATATVDHASANTSTACGRGSAARRRVAAAGTRYMRGTRLRHRLRYLHSATADQRTAASAGTKFSQGHTHRHNRHLALLFRATNPICLFAVIWP